MRATRTARRQELRLVTSAVLLLAAGGCTGTVEDFASPTGEAPEAATPAGPRGPTEPSGGRGGAGGSTGGGGGASAPAVPPAEGPAPAAHDLRTLGAGARDEGGSMRLRGLTREEYNNTIAALLGDRSSPATTWGAEVKGEGGFLEPRPISAKEVQEYREAALAVADRAKGTLTRLSSCDATASDEATCAKSFVTSFGRRAFRRPLLAEEIEDYVGLWTTARKTHGLANFDALGLVMEAMLQSPNFMYHWQLGPRPARLEGRAVRLTAHELAARLSYFLTQGPPDEELSAAADSGKLLDPAELRAHASRLVTAGKTKALLQDFVAQLLDLSDAALSEDTTMRAFDRGRRAFVDKALWTGKGTVAELLLGTEFHVNETLGKIYGVTGLKGDTLVAREIDPARRFGVLTHGDFLAKTGKDNDSLPPRRGYEVWVNLLCGELPAEVPPVPPEIERDPGQTMREHFEKKIQPVPCATACHGIVDRAGFAFENYAGPVWRDRDAANGKPIDATGSLKLPFGETLDYTGPRSFVEGLARSEEVRQCLVRQVLRLATGATETAAEEGSLRALYEAFRAGGEDVKGLVTAIVGTKAFTHRRLNPGELAQ